METDGNRKQHYIPKCYLRKFSPNKKYIFIYDKCKEKSFRNSVDSIACIDYFYELPEKYIKNLKEIPFGTKYYEKEFFANNIEKLYNQILENINVKAKAWMGNNKTEEIISHNEKELFSQLIAVQYLRMPNIRDKFADAQKKRIGFTSDIIKSALILNNPELKGKIEKINAEYDEKYNPLLHSEIYSDEELLKGIANQINKKHWVYYVSSYNDFYTSDNPILIKPHIQNQRPFYEGFGMSGAEIIFPIGSSVLLTIWDSEYFIEKQSLSDSFHTINDKVKREYNCYQYIWANKQIYSYNNNFTLIDLLKISNNGKEIFMERPKILVNGK